MALRWPLEGHFELFWALVAKWLSDGLWKAPKHAFGPKVSQESLSRRGWESIWSKTRPTGLEDPVDFMSVS